ncbi:bifunctional diguanylate cyclase/phosphodiesterase [Fulvimarina endophytica]|uniref:bifunctional diguanylate cyclase/phosphodiesterase n=1 Tax=Fulvimarina endophytica TaxID=2293836 RepID=UPI00131474CF|nr:EAL domain-containing protein [Fulvimarina endophytica]
MTQHNLWLVLMAAVICGSGSWAMVRLFLRAAAADSLERLAWVVLSAFVTGASIWCTHFVAMLGYDPGLPIGFDPVLTIISLLVAMVGSGVGILIATLKQPNAPAIGGAVVGLSIVVMHYTGMIAYRVQGIVSWDESFLAASIFVACALSAASFHAALRGGHERIGPHLATSLFFLAIVGLHFTGMTAFRVSPMRIDGSYSDPEALSALAFAIACVSLFIIGAGFASSFIDTKARATASDALANMSNGLTMLSPSGIVTLVNERVHALFHLEKDELTIGMTLQSYLAVIGRKLGWNSERIERVFDNHLLWMRSSSPTRVEHCLDDGTILAVTCQPVARGGAILTYEDVTEARNGQKTIVHMAFHDALTGLKNRRMFAQSMEELLAQGRVSMLMIDLDHFKSVNDRLGHAVGDELLKQVTARITFLLQSTEQAFRLGGDELAVLTSAPRERAIALAGDITASIAIPFEINSHVLATGCSIGIATAEPSDDMSIVQQKADLALYAAKKGGRNRFEVYRDGMLEEEAKKRFLEQDLSEALAADQLELWYQPLYSLPDRTLTGFEALLRWRHPRRGMVSPAEFIPVAESCGLITSIGAWVIDAACRQAAAWPEHIYMSINVSAVQLRSAALVSQLAQTLAKYSLSPKRIEIEITETAMVENSAQIALTLTSLRALGVRIAMDDFGTGYSSLAHLREFKIDRIKIDRSFIAASQSDPGAAAIVRAVVSMARELQIDTTAEGVEQESQLQSLLEFGCGTAQGYLLGRPLDREAADSVARGLIRSAARLKVV